jgi:hypothetical protein
VVVTEKRHELSLAAGGREIAQRRAAFRNANAAIRFAEEM